MSDTPRTIGVATIDVTSSTTADVTQRVISVGKVVVWIVTNSTNSQHTVCVTNFQAVYPANGSSDRTFPLQQENCTGNIGAGKTGVIVAKLSGNTGQILTYDVTIDNTTAADPELEI
jgi:hypothetical protein